MPEWNHNLCERCWFTGPEGALEDGRFRMPVRTKTEHTDICCRCGVPTVTGIFVRAPETELLCRGDHQHPEKWSPLIAGKWQGEE